MIVSQTPLRVSFFGGGTDFEDYYRDHGGTVLSWTIDKYVYVIVKSRHDGQIVLNHTVQERTDDVRALQHDIVREALTVAGIRGSIEITTLSDVPASGTGLGSSSALTVGVLNALFSHRGEPKGPHELAELACRIEIDILGEPIGKQDQYAAAFGGCRQYRSSRRAPWRRSG